MYEKTIIKSNNNKSSNIYIQTTIITTLLMIIFWIIYKLNKKNIKIKSLVKLHSYYIEYEEPKGNSFTIMTYNILTQRYTPKRNNPLLSLPYRMKNILNQIYSLSPDIICLQECTNDTLSRFLIPELSNKYDIISYKNEGSPLYNAICIRKIRFKVINQIKIDMTKIGVYVNGNRGIIGVELEDKCYKNKKLNVFNSHFPCRPEYEIQKAEIMMFIFDFIIFKKYDNVILAGDFNSLPNSLVVRMIYYNAFINEYNNNIDYIKNFEFNKNEVLLIDMLKKKIKEYPYFKQILNNIFESAKQMNNKYHLKSAYEYYNTNISSDIINSPYFFLRCHPKFTNYTETFKETIDYIFYSDTLIKNKILKIPDEDDIIGYLPNNTYPSDHLKLYSQFSYNS